MYFIPGAGNKHKFDTALFGTIVTPSNHDSGSAKVRIKNGWRWIVDNGAFTGTFDEKRFFGFLEDHLAYRSTCVCAVVPDVVGNAKETLALFGKYSNRIRRLGYPVAFVAQDGQEDLPLPKRFDVLFVGGSTAWKLGAGAEQCIRRAQALGKWIHIGRVNSLRRIRYFAVMGGVDSCDGTHIVYKPDVRIAQLNRWMRERPLFTIPLAAPEMA